jgi:iron(III) transport system ATP-binding protein
VLLFDEPLSNLDARLRDHLRVQLREIQTQLKITSIYVTHDQREALALADQIMMMQEGEVLQMGDPVSLYNGPKTSEIAEFLGYSNIFEVNVVGERDGLCQLAFCEHARNLDAAFINRNGDRDLTACVRPDDVSIKPLPVTAGGDESSGVNAIAGEVILASFMGSHMQYRVRAGEHEIWEILCPEVNTEIRLGSNVLLEIDPAKIHVLPKQ